LRTSADPLAARNWEILRQPEHGDRDAPQVGSVVRGGR
jgi:hypothetical protein